MSIIHHILKLEAQITKNIWNVSEFCLKHWQIITYPSHLTYSSFVIVLENKAEQKHHGGKVYNLLMSVSKKKKR